MTSTAKASVSVDTTALTDGETADATDVVAPIDDLTDLVKSGQGSVTAADTHIKHLEDALSAATGLAWAVTSPASDEGLEISLDSKLTNLLALLTAAGQAPEEAIDATGKTSGYVLTANGSGGATFAAAGGGGATPVDIGSFNAGENLAERDLVYLNGSAEWAKIDTNAAGPLAGRVRGIVNEVGGILAAASGSVRTLGEVDGFTGLTPGAMVYAHTTAGGYTQTKPTVTAGGGQVAVIAIGFASNTTAVMVWPGVVEYLKRESLADSGTLTITHHSDAVARGRRTYAYTSTVEPVSIESYAFSNQDWDVRLQASGAGATESSGAQSGIIAVIGDLDGVDYWTGQSFQITGGRLSQFTFTLSGNVGTPAGNLVWKICANDTNKPGTVLATGSIANGSVTPSAVNTVTVSNGPLLVGATTYWLVLHSSINESTNNYWQWVAKSAGTYASGSMVVSTNGGSSWDTTTYLAVDTTFSVTTAAEGKAKLAQSCQIGSGADIYSLKLWLKKVGGPGGNLSISIQGDSAGDPDGTPVSDGTSELVAASGISTSYGWIEFTFATPPTLSASTTYWLVLETTDSASATNYVTWGSDGSAPSYADGEMKHYIAAWAAEGKDAVFDIFEAGTFYDEPCAIRRWSRASNEFDIAVRFDDGAGANGDTMTIFKNISGAEMDVTCAVQLE